MIANDTALMEKLVSLCKQRGFIYPGSELYGGLANAWDFGPLGAQLKMNLKQLWWKCTVESRADMFGFDGAILMNPKVWEASKHVATFNDPLVECKACHHRRRADQSLDNVCERCGGELTAPRDFNLMFKTVIGPTADIANSVYLRPETAQALFINFKNVLQTMRPDLPFGLAQIGKAFRNEITPGNYIFRTLEFEQMEIEYFVAPEDWEKNFEHWRNWLQQWAETIGLTLARLHQTEITAGDRAHYSQRTIDFEFDWPFGRKELWGLAYRADFDLKNHAAASGEHLIYTDPHESTRQFIPHVIEPSLGVERTVLAILLSAFDEEMVRGEQRTVLRFKPALAPYQAAILPLLKKPELVAKARPLYDDLVKQWRCDYDQTQSIGRRYRRQDEIGTPWCITVDFDTLTDNCATVRDRDSMKQDRIPLGKLTQYLSDHVVAL